MRRRGGTGRGADDKICGLGQIETTFGQPGDDPDQPGVTGRTSTTKDQGNVFIRHMPSN